MISGDGRCNYSFRVPRVYTLDVDFLRSLLLQYHPYIKYRYIYAYYTIRVGTTYIHTVAAVVKSEVNALPPVKVHIIIIFYIGMYRSRAAVSMHRKTKNKNTHKPQRHPCTRAIRGIYYIVGGQRNRVDCTL